jgi:cell division protein FtsW
MTARGKTDYVLFGAVVLTMGFGLFMVYSATAPIAEVKYRVASHHFVLRQAIAAALAMLLLMWLGRRDYRIMQNSTLAFAALGVAIVLLALVIVVDPRKRWIPLYFTTLQPSEIAKPALILFLAWFIRHRQSVVNDRHTLLPAGLALAFLAAAVVVADLGTAAVLVATAGAMFWVAGLRWRTILRALAAGLVAMSVAIAWKPYRLARVIAHFDPEYRILVHVDPQKRILAYATTGGPVKTDRYQIQQSLIAVGSGGVTGQGPMEGIQKLGFLPEAHTDFIYAVVAEEMGLLGSLAVLAAFLVILYRGYRVWWIAPDEFGRLLAVGITTSLVFQALMNMTVVLDLMPTKGIPLPMISFGGSSLVGTAISLGVLLSVSERAG